MSDHFSSMRFVIICALILMVGVIVTSMVGMSIDDALKGMVKPKLIFLLLFVSTGKLFSFVQFIGFFGALIGIVLGFDAINRERTSRTLGKILSQPIYRDAVINGKFLAGVVTIATILFGIVLIVSGLGIRLIGLVPGIEEIWRLLIYLIIAVFYVSFWLGLSILFSVLFRSTATSALASLAIWIFFSFFVGLGASFIADAAAPLKLDGSTPAEMVVKHEKIAARVSMISPVALYTDATTVILDPTRKSAGATVLIGPIQKWSIQRFQKPLSVMQSFFVVSPYIVSIIAITLICFGVCYVIFMRQEIRTL